VREAKFFDRRSRRRGRSSRSDAGGVRRRSGPHVLAKGSEGGSEGRKEERERGKAGRLGRRLKAKREERDKVSFREYLQRWKSDPQVYEKRAKAQKGRGIEGRG